MFPSLGATGGKEIFFPLRGGGAFFSLGMRVKVFSSRHENADSKFTSIYITQLFRSVQNALFPGKTRRPGACTGGEQACGALAISLEKPDVPRVRRGAPPFGRRRNRAFCRKSAAFMGAKHDFCRAAGRRCAPPGKERLAGRRPGKNAANDMSRRFLCIKKPRALRQRGPPSAKISAAGGAGRGLSAPVRPLPARPGRRLQRHGPGKATCRDDGTLLPGSAFAFRVLRHGEKVY